MRNESRVLFITSSVGQLTDGTTTGLWMPVLSEAYYALRHAGHTVHIASLSGGDVPIDPRSQSDAATTKSIQRRAMADPVVRFALAASVPLSNLDPDAYRAVFFPGGHGAMMELPDNAALGRHLAYWLDVDTLVAAVCHGPAALLSATKIDGDAAVIGRHLTGFTNQEEHALGLAESVPFSLESRLRDAGAAFSSARAFTSHAIRDGNLITGQNPQSTPAVTGLLKQALRRKRMDRRSSGTAVRARMPMARADTHALGAAV